MSVRLWLLVNIEKKYVGNKGTLHYPYHDVVYNQIQQQHRKIKRD